MTQKSLSLLASALCLLFLAAPLLARGPHIEHHSSDAEVFELSDLANGETRTFGTGEHTITATRTGDRVSITMNDPEDTSKTTFDCLIGTDNCSVVVDNGEDAHKMIVIKRTSDDDAGEHTISAFSTSGDGDTWVADDKQVHIVGGDHAAMFIGEGDGAGFKFETSDGGEGQGIRIMKFGMGDKIMLRCPEGDTMMTLDKDEADVEYRCPKHGNLLEKAAGDHMRTKVIERHVVREKHADENQ